MSRAPDEDLIEATIRRVAASKAARVPEAVEDAAYAPDQDDPSAAGLHLVPAIVHEPLEAAPPVRPPADESLIEATLRRIEAEQAARAAEAAAGAPSIDASASQPTPRPGLHLVPSGHNGHAQVAPPPSAPAAPVHRNLATSQEPDVAEAHHPEADISAMRRDLDDTRRQLRELSARVDALLASPPEQRPWSSPPPSTASSSERAPSGSSDDDWDDTPVITRMDTGLPPRPGIVRDALPAPAATGRTEQPKTEAGIASVARPADAAPHEGGGAKRGFDLLPRNYRITVEDKRRGVDLVPLHRALLGIEGVSDMSLLSYSNGTAIVALEATVEIKPDALGAAVAHAMAREVKVEVHNEQTMVVKLAED